MNTIITPNFRGWRALIVHRQSENVDRLVRQLSRLGMECEQVWPKLVQLSDADVVFFDGDNGFDGLFPWPEGHAPVPMVALLGSEAPGRLEWALRQGVSAHLLKPIGSGGVFSTLVIAVSNFTQQQMLAHEIAKLKTKARLRPKVVRAILSVMQSHSLDEDAAYAFIRSEAMQRRQSVEELCESDFFRPSNPRGQTRVKN
ncbi:ANTAR domain-containing response regulator [uncultured Maritalea sp.]|jgi:AmiR/NasT family two-component response regulator|uniref:ANTAR domain-containing response regulator n=1 Tax=uncultured Maritalea sp. TaxID=757249 RepID=UPI00260897BB|nr:ANTAR domain-containing protein [uncultured Maritalea sp.]